MTKLGLIVFTMGVMFFLSAMMIDTFDNLLLYFDHLIKALTDKEYFLSSIEGTFRVMLWFFMMLIGGLICLSGLKMMKLTDRKNEFESHFRQERRSCAEDILKPLSKHQE